MASITATLPPPLILSGRNRISRTVPRLPFSNARERQKNISFLAKANQESSESSSSLGVVKSVENVWDKPEDLIGLTGLGFAAVVAFWASSNLITAIEKLPVIPNALEVIGVLFSSWFVYRYLLFKPDREELFQIVKRSVSNILGQ